MAPPPAKNGRRLADLAALTGAQLDGDGETVVTRVATLERAGAGDIAFLANPRYRAQLASTKASAVIVGPGDAGGTALPRLVAANPYAVYAKVAAALHPETPSPPGIHPTASVAATARIAASASIGAGAAIGDAVTVGERATVGALCAIGAGASLGDDVRLHAGVTLYPRTVLGARTIVHSGAVIGADGFGMAEEGGRWIKIAQLGRVGVGADVEIGANTTIDRGAIDDTVIEDDVKLDNQIQIGHNCVIGAHTAIAGCVGIAGSTRIGSNCRIGGAAMISGHLDIPDGTVISGSTGVYDSIREAGVYTSAFPALPHRRWRRVMSELRRLTDLARRVGALERAQQDAKDGR
ncbi:MAG: UDP-3-O-(3-hydroxymyristoyl)glucosamine N-acyltransferase [Betaproteobacteria bacterium]